MMKRIMVYGRRLCHARPSRIQASSFQISKAGMEPAVVSMSAQRLVRFYSSEGLGGHATQHLSL
jgi:hypothetical protein